jgi:Holliday junction resolvase RusA-like endonuclease
MEHIKITGLVPSKKNSRITVRATGRSFPSKKYSEWHRDASLQLMKCTAKFDKVSSIKIVFHYGTKRAFDLTNKAESIMDLLVDNEIIADDNFTVVPEINLAIGEYSKNEYVTEIYITP